MITANSIQNENQSVNEQLLNVKDFAQIAGMKPHTVRILAQRGKLQAIKLGKCWRFSRSLLIPSQNSMPIKHKSTPQAISTDTL